MNKFIKVGISLLGRNPRVIWHLRYLKRFHKILHLKHPRDIFEIMIKQSIDNANNPLWVRLADKKAVREYVISQIGSQYVNRLYGCYSCAEEIDFEKLPKSFVLKTNNGCGTNLIVRDKRTLDTREACLKLNKWLAFPYGELTGQLHYTKISRCIIAEEYMTDSLTKGKSLVDYKFYCIKGEAKYVMVCSDRKANSHDYRRMIYTMNWLECPEYTVFCESVRDRTPRPVAFDDMRRVVNILAKPFEFVRIDFYQINGQPIFGEFTFTPGLDYHTETFLLELLCQLQNK